MHKHMKEKTTIFVLVIIYLVGIGGIISNISPYFIFLTPLNLLLSLFMVLCFHRAWNRSSVLFLVLAFVIGFGIEILGVNTGLIFGDYQYGPVLGWKLWGTPLMIGVNWIMLTYCTGMTMNRVFPRASHLYKSLLGAAAMTFLDFWIEPVAIHYDFWNWSGNGIPIQNYVAWFVIAFFILEIFFQLVEKLTNKVAEVLLILQFVFFFVLNIYVNNFI